jgi:hypothetical protein
VDHREQSRGKSGIPRYKGAGGRTPVGKGGPRAKEDDELAQEIMLLMKSSSANRSADTGRDISVLAAIETKNQKTEKRRREMNAGYFDMRSVWY